MSVFQKFFSPMPKSVPSTHVFMEGDCFPCPEGVVSGARNVHLFVTLYCQKCLNILESLPELITGLDAQVQLYVTDISKDELREMKLYFKDQLVLHPTNQSMQESVYRVYITPSAYITDQENKVISYSGGVEGVEDILKMMNEGR